MSGVRYAASAVAAPTIVGVWFLIAAGGIYLMLHASPLEVGTRIGLALGFIWFGVIALWLRLLWLARRRRRTG